MAISLSTRWRRINSQNLKTIRKSPLSELSGSLGDLGTLLPLLIALTLTGSISLSSTLVFSGLANIATGLAFGVPLPVQPMKAIAAVAISQSYTKAETASAGLFVGGVVTVFSITGLLRWFGRVVPVPVVRGIQVGAGLSLAISAGTTLLKPLSWIEPSWADNWIWAIGAFIALLLSSLVQRDPYALTITTIALVLAGIQLSTYQSDTPSTTAGFEFWHPAVLVPSPLSFRKAALEAGLPQLPLTTLNSILAVTSLSASLFPTFPPPPSTTSLGLSVGIANLISCWFSAMPICHGSGGLAGQYRFGARSGARIIILGAVKVLLGLFAGESIVPLLAKFPKSLLGVMVLAAGVELAKVGQSIDESEDLWAAAEEENEEITDPSVRDKKARVGEEQRRERWMVMLVTVAGCLAFKNDAVGFIAGMVWHWGLKISGYASRWRGGLSRSHVNHENEEGESLLARNYDGPDGRVN